MQIKTPGILQTSNLRETRPIALEIISGIRSGRSVTHVEKCKELSEVVVRSRRKLHQEAPELLLKLSMRCPSVRNVLSEEK